MLNIVKKSLWNCRTWTLITSRWRESISNRDMEKNLLVLDLIIKMITIASAYEISSAGLQLCGTFFPVSVCLVLLQLSYTSTVTNREIQLKLGLNSELDPLLMGEKIRFGPKQLASSHSFPAKWTWVSYENLIFSATDDAQVRNDCLNRLLTYIYLLIASF